MQKRQTNTMKGFTIIEVVLVLAIAGLIFLMVFIALPALQRNQRDTQRRQDYAQLASQIQGYMTNNGNKLPSAGASLEASKYMNKDGLDPKGEKYTINVTSSSPSSDPAESTVYVVTGIDNCNDGKPGTGGKAKNFVVYGYLEGGSTYCQAY